jgi:tyrosinase
LFSALLQHSMLSALNPAIWVYKGDSQDGPGLPVNETGTGTQFLGSLPMSSHLNLFLAALTPFWNANTTLLASSGTTDKEKLGYCYPEFNGIDTGSPQDVEMTIGNIVKRLYNFSILGSFMVMSSPTTTSFAAGPAATVPVETGRAATQGEAANPGRGATPHAQSSQVSGGHDHGSRPTVHSSQHVPPSQVLWEWTARIEFNKYELGVSFSVPIFLGAVPEDPQEWLVSPNFVGAHHAYVNSTAVLRANRQNQGNPVVEGFVHLNKAITQHSGLGSLEPAVVEPYLTQKLDWRVQKVSLHVVLRLLPGLLYHCRRMDLWLSSNPSRSPSLRRP